MENEEIEMANMPNPCINDDESKDNDIAETEETVKEEISLNNEIIEKTQAVNEELSGLLRNLTENSDQLTNMKKDLENLIYMRKQTILGTRIIYLMNDVHYYLADWKPVFKGIHLISGAHFPVIPGINYQLPFGEGLFSIVPESFGGKMVNQYVRMTTKRSGETY